MITDAVLHKLANMVNLTEEASYPTPVANSPLLPLLLAFLMSQKHSPDVTKNFQSEYDYIIVGAGSAGSVVASRLSEMPSVTVLLLEAGKAPPLLTEVPAFKPYFINTDIDWKYVTEPQKFAGIYLKDRHMMWSSAKVIGGGSIHNDMIVTRGNRRNYDLWSSLGATGWSYKEVLPYFKKLENSTLLKTVEREYHGYSGPTTITKPHYYTELKKAVLKSAIFKGIPIIDVNGRHQGGFADIQMNMEDGQRCSVAKAYLVRAEERENLDIVPEAFVTKVMISENRATGVLFEYRGQQYKVNARREVIVSAGTIRSPQLLMLSGVGPKQHLESLGIPVSADLPVGYNLQDHVGSILLYEMSEDIVPSEKKLSDPKYITEYIQERKGPLIGSPVSAFWYNRAYEMWRKSPDYSVVFAEFKAEALRRLVKEEVYDKAYRPYENKTLFACVAHNLHPKSRGRIWLRSGNPYDQPHIDPRYLEYDEDVRDIAQGLKLCNKLVKSPEMRLIGAKPTSTPYPGCENDAWNEDRYYGCIAKAISLVIYHYVGSNQMGNPDCKHTVVDPKLRVKGISGLRVVDASIMPTVPSGNTNIPTIMIAEKASDMIKEDCKSW